MTPGAREAAFKAIAQQQLGSIPHSNTRILTVKGRQDGILLEEFLRGFSGWVTTEEQQAGLAQGRITVDGVTPELRRVLRGGNQVQLTFLDVVEPPVATDICVLFEDDAILVVLKPAPMAVHPSGRYNRHSFTEIAKSAWPDVTLKPVHRLDVNTGGILIFGKTASVAQSLVKMFRDQAIQKTYLVRVEGHLELPRCSIDSPIAKRPGEGGLREVDSAGLPALTLVEALESYADGTSLVKAFPKTGRTNQIRVHMKSIGHPVVGDRAYGAGLKDGETFAEPDDQLHLFAQGVSFLHPVTKAPLSFEVEPPLWFTAQAFSGN